MEPEEANKPKKVKYSEAQIKALQAHGVLGFTDKEDFVYVPEAFRTEKDEKGEPLFNKTEWPIFELKGKDGIEIAKYEDKGSYTELPSDSFKKENQDKSVRIVTQSGALRLDILRNGVKGWKNFFDADGVEIPFRLQGTIISNHSLKRIPANLQLELAEAISERTNLTKEEKEGLDY